mgnify:CR=1 FL=1
MMKTIRWTGAAMAACLVAWAGVGCGPGSGTGEATTSAKPYPLDVCIVSGEKLDDHGGAYTFVHAGQEIKLCCKDCLKDFQQDPAKYLAKLTGNAAAPEGQSAGGHQGHQH